MGGVNPAGLTSNHLAFKGYVFNELTASQQETYLLHLASLTGTAKPTTEGIWKTKQGENLTASQLIATYQDTLLNNSLIRQIHPDWFDVNAIPNVRGEGVETKEAQVQAAGMLPTGFAPKAFYRSAHHPRALQMAVFGMSDLLGQSGLEWHKLSAQLRPDQIGVFASNSIGQLDTEGWGGLLQSPVIGKRTTSKQMPLGYPQMTADFINAYILGNVGHTSGLMGACATFLYNLQAASSAISSGKIKLAVVGTSDAPITPEIIEGFRAMGALADNTSLKNLDGKEELTEADYRLTCRPFAQNCGFTIGEAAQFILLAADDLAVEVGGQILASVPEVFIHADGYKRSISAPGIGNYLTLAKAAAYGRSLLGEEAVQQRSYVHAHGTSTPKNRTTESHVINQVAKAMGIESWPVAAIKAFIGHSQGTAGGDQLMAALGTWATGWLPGISTVTEFADDVYASNLSLTTQHQNLGAEALDMALINAKGFGGNNASALVVAPHITQQMLAKRHGKQAMAKHQEKLEATLAASAEHTEKFTKGEFNLKYEFGQQVLEGDELDINSKEITIPGYEQAVDLNLTHPFTDML